MLLFSIDRFDKQPANEGILNMKHMSDNYTE